MMKNRLGRWTCYFLNAPNIGDNVNECEDSVGNQKIRLKNFEESLVLYCQGVKEMESNICSKLEKISGQANETCDTAKDWNVSLNAKIEGTTKTNEIYLNEVTSKMNDLSDNLDKLNYENSSEMKYKLNEVYQSEDEGNVDTVEDKSTIQKVIDEFKGIIDKFVDRIKSIFEYIGKEAGKVYEQITNQLNKLKDSLVSLGKVIYEFLKDAGVVAVKLIGTLVCIGVDWCLLFVIGTVELLAKIAEYVPLGDLYELSAEDTTKDIQNVEEVVHNFFKGLAPYKDLYEYGETALDIITIFLSVKSLIKTGGKLLVNSGKILSEIEKIFQETGGGLQLAIEGGGKLGTEAIEAAGKLEQSLGKSIKDVVKDSLGLGSIINKIESEVMGGDDTRGAEEVEEAVSRIDEVKVKFNYKTKYDQTEFVTQLADQEAGMNKLTVDEYLQNRQRYIDEGRAIEGNMAQQAARKEALANKIDELLDSGMSYQEAETQANKWMESQAALHNPDQIAGGNPLNIGGMGNKRINSSIGAQWKYRIDDVDEQIEEMAKKMTDAERKSTYLNVKLTY